MYIVIKLHKQLVLLTKYGQTKYGQKYCFNNIFAHILLTTRVTVLVFTSTVFNPMHHNYRLKSVDGYLDGGVPGSSDEEVIFPDQRSDGAVVTIGRAHYRRILHRVHIPVYIRRGKGVNL